MSGDKRDAHFWREGHDGDYHGVILLPPGASVEFTAVSWRRLKSVMRAAGFETTSLREREVAVNYTIGQYRVGPYANSKP